MFSTIAVPFDAYRDLPDDCRWLVQCLARYADRDGRCWPSMRQLVGDVRKSLSTICRRLKKLAEIGVFHRERIGVGRYVYTLAEPYRLRWKPGVSSPQRRVSQGGTQEARPAKYIDFNRDQGKWTRTDRHELDPDRPRWVARLALFRKTGKWDSNRHGPAPGQPNCWAPRDLLNAWLTEQRNA